jgi:glycosyltransferase involved in cell wall biosynthesis
MKKTICLNMIVKNESKVIVRCLQSLKDLIDYWVIVDTGSSDGTQQLILEVMEGYPGELYQSSWVNFSWNRNEALSYSKGKGDYLLFIDADEMFHYSVSFQWPDLVCDLYFMKVRYQIGSEFSRVVLVNNHLDWKWKGVIHEEIRSSQAKGGGMLTNIVTITTLDGEPTQQQLIEKNWKDIQILEKAIINEPDNSRYIFHLAMTYEIVEDYSKAIEFFEKRLLMAGSLNDGQIFYSLFRIARIQEKLKKNSIIFIETYQKAYSSRPTRAEPLYHLANHYLEVDQPLKAYCHAKTGLTIPIPKNDPILVDIPIYNVYLDLVLIESARRLNNWEVALHSCLKLLSQSQLNEEQRVWVYKKMTFIKQSKSRT